MARILVLGAGISGHTAAAFLKKKLVSGVKACFGRPADLQC